jgi:hypothetical protein
MECDVPVTIMPARLDNLQLATVICRSDTVAKTRTAAPVRSRLYSPSHVL